MWHLPFSVSDLSKTLLYIHGMGGGVASRIPSILSANMPDISVVIRTYDFNPSIAWEQIRSWYDEVHPDIVVGESMGANFAVRLEGVPIVLVSPAFGVPGRLAALAPAACIPFVAEAAERKYAREGSDGRQKIHFDPSAMREWRHFSDLRTLRTHPFAFFGKRDHYRRSGIVSLRRYEKFFGADSYAEYDGTHYMEENFILSLLIPKIREVVL